MKIAFVYFTYKNDNKMLKLSIDSVIKNAACQYDIYVYDDANNPLYDIPKNCFYLKTTFDRNGNLNGINCIKNIIQIYSSLIDKYDWIVKIDSDTYLNFIDWLENVDHLKFVQVGTLNLSEYNKTHKKIICYGALHGFSKLGVDRLSNCLSNIELFNKKLLNINQYTQRLAEDYCTCRIACDDNEDLNYYILNKYNNPLLDRKEYGLYFDVKYVDFQHFMKNIPIKFLKQYTAITFKDLSYFDENRQIMNCDVKRNIAEERMYKYWKFDHERR